VASIEGSHALLFLIASYHNEKPYTKRVPLSALLDKKDPFFGILEYLGPRKNFEWIQTGVVVRTKSEDPFYAQVLEFGPNVSVGYVPPIRLGEPTLQGHLSNYPFLQRHPRITVLLITDFVNLFERVTDPSPEVLWIEDHARRLQTERLLEVDLHAKLSSVPILEERGVPTVPESPRGLSIYERIRTTPRPTEDEDK